MKGLSSRKLLAISSAISFQPVEEYSQPFATLSGSPPGSGGVFASAGL